MPNLTWITKKYFSISPQAINLGNCYNWAFLAYQFYNNTELFSTEEHGGHAFIKIGSKFFDAESPRGENNWSDLKFFKRACYHYYKRGHGPGDQPCPIVSQTLNDFLLYWNMDLKWNLRNICS